MPRRTLALMTTPTSEHQTTAAEAMAALTGPFGEVVAGLPAAAWQAPSPCDGWTAADVLHHVIATQTEFLAQHDLAGQPAPDAAAVAADPVGCWHTHASWLHEVLSDAERANRPIDGHFGPTTIAGTLLSFYGFDLIVHRWDIARAAGRDERFGEQEMDAIDALIAATGEMLYGEGICDPALPVPDDADRQTRLLAALGRRG